MIKDDTGETAQEVSPGQLIGQEELRRMRRAGLPKPMGVTWPEWLGPKKLNHRHKTVALLAAQGLTQTRISQELGITQSRLSIIMNTRRMQAEIARCAKEIYGQDTQNRFTKLAEKSFGIVESILDNPQERSSLRYQVAKDCIDRQHGKAPERLEIRNSTIKDLFEAMDKMSRAQMLGIRPEVALEAPKAHTIEAELVAEEPGPQAPAEGTAKSKADPYSAIDSWISANVPRSSGVGTK